MILIDTDICIDLLRHYTSTEVWFGALPEIPALPGFTVMELLAGCRSRADERTVNKLVRRLSVVWPTPAACQSAMNTYASHHLSHSLGVIDSLIAATAMENGARLYTFNLRHFRAVAGLDVQRPYKK